MRPFPGMIALSVLAMILLCFLVSSASSAGTGVRVYAPAESYVKADTLPLSYNGSFIVRNDGYLEGVYIINVAVDDPVAITWVSVTPSGFVLAPGETRVINFDVNVSEGQAVPGIYRIAFMPALLPPNVEPYLDTFANYVSQVDRYNFTVEIPATDDAIPLEAEGGTPVVFSEEADRLNLVQYTLPSEGGRSVVQIDRAVRINIPSGAQVDQPVNISLSVFEGLSPRGIELMAISPDGIFYPIEGGNFTFGQIGRWGIIALVGDQILLGKPIHVTQGGVRLVMPGIGTILAAISLLLLLAIVPIWLAGRGTTRVDPYDDIAYRGHVIKKYIDQFDQPRLRRAVSQLRHEYDDLVARHVRGNHEKARASIKELETLSRLEMIGSGQDAIGPGEEGMGPAR